MEFKFEVYSMCGILSESIRLLYEHRNIYDLLSSFIISSGEFDASDSGQFGHIEVSTNHVH